MTANRAPIIDFPLNKFGRQPTLDPSKQLDIPIIYRQRSEGEFERKSLGIPSPGTSVAGGKFIGGYWVVVDYQDTLAFFGCGDTSGNIADISKQRLYLTDRNGVPLSSYEGTHHTMNTAAMAGSRVVRFGMWTGGPGMTGIAHYLGDNVFNLTIWQQTRPTIRGQDFARLNKSGGWRCSWEGPTGAYPRAWGAQDNRVYTLVHNLSLIHI